MSKEVYVMVPVKVIVNTSDEVIGMPHPVDLDDCQASYKEFGSYNQKHLIMDQLRLLYKFEAEQYKKEVDSSSESKDLTNIEYINELARLGRMMVEEQQAQEKKNKKSVKVQAHAKAKK
jgi:hypothetical protein